MSTCHSSHHQANISPPPACGQQGLPPFFPQFLPGQGHGRDPADGSAGLRDHAALHPDHHRPGRRRGGDGRARQDQRPGRQRQRAHLPEGGVPGGAAGERALRHPGGPAPGEGRAGARSPSTIPPRGAGRSSRAHPLPPVTPRRPTRTRLPTTRSPTASCRHPPSASISTSRCRKGTEVSTEVASAGCPQPIPPGAEHHALLPSSDKRQPPPGLRAGRQRGHLLDRDGQGCRQPAAQQHRPRHHRGVCKYEVKVVPWGMPPRGAAVAGDTPLPPRCST